MANYERAEAVRAQLPEVSLPEFDFLDSSFFHINNDTCAPHRKLPSPQEVLEASGERMGEGRFWHFRDRGVFVKFGPRSRVHIEEALALRFVNKMFSANEVPAPEVFGWKTAGDNGNKSTFIYMSFLPGETLEEAWETLSQAEKTSISHQLADVVKALRSVEQTPADRFIGSLNRGPVQDIYFSPDYHKGPFATPREYHDFMKSAATYWLPPGVEHPEEPYRAMLPDTTGVFLTHGDLHLGNILVAKSPGGQTTLTGVVDWGQAGWSPDYWEYCKAMIVGPYGDEWRDAGFVNIPLPAHETELQAFWEYWHWRLP